MKTSFIVLCLFGFSSLFAKPCLSDYKRKVYSQWGEDGIIEKIFSLIGTSSKIAVEFGASDGFAFSNTANLWTKDPSWRAYLIERDLVSYNQLLSNVESFPCVPIYRTVGISQSDSLEAILKEYGVRIQSIFYRSISMETTIIFSIA